MALGGAVRPFGGNRGGIPEKGRSCYIEGRLKTRKWQDKDGHGRYTTEIVADSMQLLGGRDSMGGGDEAGSSYGGGYGGKSVRVRLANAKLT